MDENFVKYLSEMNQEIKRLHWKEVQLCSIKKGN